MIFKKEPVFPKKRLVGKRPWGTEEMLAIIPGVLTLKKLTIKKKRKGGLQFHRLKNECVILLSGKMQVNYFNKKKKIVSKILKSGQCFHFPPGAIHQEIALEKCVIIEASSPHLNDRVRVEKFFGIKEKGLPTTKLNEIIKL
jgi:mannose-6-phosphate isomerase